MNVLNSSWYFKYRGCVLGFILLHNKSVIYPLEPDAKTNVNNVVHEVENKKNDGAVLALLLSNPSSAPLPCHRGPGQ